MAATDELHDTVAVPVGGTVTLLGVIAPQVKPVGAVSVSVTVPLNVPTAVTVMVDDADVPTLVPAGDVADMVKSDWVKLKVAVVLWVIVPLVPVIVTVKLDAVLELQDNEAVAVGGTVTLDGVMAPQVSPAGTVSVRLTVPLNVPTAETVIVEVAVDPTVAEGEVAAMLKSLWLKVKVALVECDRVPLVPVIVRVKVPAVLELHETVAVPELVTLLGVIAPQVRPDGTVSVNVTVPVNPLTADTVMVDVAELPTDTAAGEVAEIVKSVTVNVAVVL